MGRLDEHAKKRIVELRKAGLSFRKIKKVLELDNIRVTPQAVYLFLKRKNVDPEQPGGSAGPQPVQGSVNPWEDEQLWNLLNENGPDQSKRKDSGSTTGPGGQRCLGQQQQGLGQQQGHGRQQCPGGQQSLVRQQCPDGQQGLVRQQCPDGQQGLVRQQCPDGQQGLVRQQCPDGQQGLVRQQCPDGQQGLVRQQCPDGQQGLGRQQCPDGQQGLGRQQCPDGQQGLGRQQCADGQQGLGRQQCADGQQGLGRQQCADGQQNIGRQQCADGQQNIGRQQCPDGQQNIGRQQGTDGQLGLVRQQGPNGRQQVHEGEQCLVRKQDPDGQQGSGPRLPALPSGGAVSQEIADNKDGIQIVSVTSLCEDGHQFGKVSAPVGRCPGIQLPPQPKKSDCPVSSASQPPMSASRPPPVVHINPQQQLNGRGRMPFPLPRNPALIVRKKIVDRAIHLQKRVNIQNGQAVSGSSQMLPFLVGVPPSGQTSRMNHSVLPNSHSMGTQVVDAFTQTMPTGAACSLANQNSPWSGQSFAQSPGGSPKVMVEKLEAMHGEVQKLTQALHAMAERQNRMERQQEQQQQRFQQEVLGTLQQISSSLNQQQQQLCHTQSPLNQACLPYGNMAEAAPALPSFGQFKMELL